ncbi:GDP-mannose 4,6-dehydratase [Patescibacteria group bacterium]|nr:GDP-mannose 4,6-dehydratase [Patescibacteria group bacterium]
MKILVTGGAGFIGSHLVDKLIKVGHQVFVIDNLSSGKKENLNPKARFYQADIQDPKISNIFKKEKPKVVFHFAAHIEARESIKNPVSDAKINILGSLNILENCRKFKVKELIFASSGGEIYGAAKKIPTPENYPPHPLSPYGVSKFAVEKYLEVYYQLFGLAYKALRYGNVYGPRQNSYGEAGVVAIFTNKMLKNEQVFIHGNGRQTKDYIFIEDAIEATILSFKKDFIGPLNIATGKETSVLEIFDQIKKMTESSVRKKHVPLPAIAFPRGCLDVKRAKKTLGWQPKYSFVEGLEKTVNWFKNYENSDCFRYS